MEVWRRHGRHEQAALHFWAVHKLEWPLLFLAACLLLCSSLTQVKDERVHSVGCIACSRLLASMTASMLRMLVVEHQTLRNVLDDSKSVRRMRRRKRRRRHRRSWRNCRRRWRS